MVTRFDSALLRQMLSLKTQVNSASPLLDLICMSVGTRESSRLTLRRRKENEV